MRNVKNIAIVTSLAFMLQPGVAYLASGDVLMQDVKIWSTESASMDADDAWMQTERVYQQNQDVFPITSQGSSQGRLDEMRDDRIADFVSVQIGGVLIVFSDVLKGAWFAPYVREIAERGIVSGYRDAAGNPTGKFGPQDNVTIEQMAKVMVNASGRLTSDCATSPVVNATASGSWSALFISCAEKLQWAVYGDGTVDVHRHATRAEVVMTLLQAFNKPIEQSGVSEFTDVEVTSGFAPAIDQARRDGIVSGYTDADGNSTGQFGPNDPVTRAEFAKMVTVGMQVYGSNK